jgi:hypothetical protein
MEINLTEVIIALIGLVFTCVITPLMAAGFKWLKGRTKNEALRSALDEAQKVADYVVAALQANVVDGLKAKNADGKLTADEAKAVMDQAVENFVMNLSQRSLEVLQENADDITTYITALLEARLAALKK